MPSLELTEETHEETADNVEQTDETETDQLAETTEQEPGDETAPPEDTEATEEPLVTQEEDTQQPDDAEPPVEEQPADGAEPTEDNADEPKPADTEGRPNEADGSSEQVAADTAEPQQEEGAEQPTGDQPPAEGDGSSSPQPYGAEPGTPKATEDGSGTPKPEGDGTTSPHPEEGTPGTPKVEDGSEAQAPEGDGTNTPQADGEGSATPKVDGEEETADGEQHQAEDGGEKTEEGDRVEKGEGEAEDTGETTQEEEGAERKSPVPQSDTFGEGERPESPVAVGEKLSREASPLGMVTEEHESVASPPVPGTPQDSDEEEEYDEEEEEEEEEYEEEPEFDREQLIERYHQAIAERQQFQEQNYQLQHKLAEFFRKKKSDDSRQDVDKNVTDQEQRYLKYMANLDDLRRQDGEERDAYKIQIEELKDRCNDKQSKVDDERVKFMEFKRQVALGSINSRSGKTITQKDIEQYLSTENRKEAEVVNVRLENIKLKNKLRKKESALKSKEELAEGLHLIDFEQLKIENQTYNEKIEERNEELLKLRKKITSTVQVLTHLKEKLQFVNGENVSQTAKLRQVEEQAARKRDILSRTKQARDALRIDNTKLRQNCGLLGNEPLLRDFEDRKDESEDLKSKLDHLKMSHAELTLNLTGVRRKIEQARGNQA